MLVKLERIQHYENVLHKPVFILNLRVFVKKKKIKIECVSTCNDCLRSDVKYKYNQDFAVLFLIPFRFGGVMVSMLECSRLWVQALNRSNQRLSN